ncbi:MAG TPA: Gfo/Idh/MocA family oxidoreductase, partial [Pyrinomonadaceae bacterium]|nr:Gfo/Idh/MocA family oxidoreductase [Pyrinomonadaceae bacterium]
LLLECVDGDRTFPVHMHLDFLQRPPQRTCEIVGDTGKVLYDYHANTVEHHSTEPRTVTVHRFDDFDRNKMFLDELSHFLECLKGEAAPMVDLRGAKSSMRIAQAALESLASGRSVELN